jgi:hypothetical protein
VRAGTPGNQSVKQNKKADKPHVIARSAATW